MKTQEKESAMEQLSCDVEWVRVGWGERYLGV